MAALIAFKEGIGHPAFGVALTLAFIVMLDANSRHRQVGKHATAINKWQQWLPITSHCASAWATPAWKLQRTLPWGSQLMLR